jgi:hypothetical protein
MSCNTANKVYCTYGIIYMNCTVLYGIYVQPCTVLYTEFSLGHILLLVAYTAC